MTEEISKDMIRGYVNAIVLNILSQHDSYGYEIAKTIRELSDNQYEMKEATLYSVFRRLEKAGDIRSYWGDESQGGRRKYYAITDQGRDHLQKAKGAWNFVKEIITLLMTGEINGEDE